MRGLRDLPRRVLIETLAAFAVALILLIGATFAKHLAYPVPLWLPLALLVPTILVTPWLMELRRRARRRLFLVMPAFEHKNWFAQLLKELLSALERAGYDLVVKLPAHDFDAQSMSQSLRQLARERLQYAGGFVVAAKPWEIQEELRDFCRTLNRPVVFVDVRPFEQLALYPPMAAFVGSSADEIGRKAADTVASWAKVDGKKAPRILVIGSNSQSQRQEAFESRIRENIPKATVRVTNEGLFSRERAHILTEAYYKEVSASGRPDYIFCTNDEMALGAMDAISSVPLESRRVSVIGVDGTPEALALIRAGTVFRATIVQSAADVASEAVALATKLLEHKRVAATEHLLSTEVVGRR